MLMALSAPVIQSTVDKETLLKDSFDKEWWGVHYLWGEADTDYIISNPAPPNPNNYSIYPIFGQPQGILSDGSDLNTHIILGQYPGQEYVEAIYISTGDVGKGLLDISPRDGFHTSLPSLTDASSHIDKEIPDNMGPVVSPVKIYHSDIRINLMIPKEGIVLITSTTGNIVAIKAEMIGYDPSRIGEDLLPIRYTRLWTYNAGEPISTSASVFYGNSSTKRDDRGFAVTDSGTVCALTPEGNNSRPEVLWTSPHLNGTGFYSPISVDAGNLIVVTSRDGHFYGLNASNGSILWNSTFDVEFSSPFLGYYYRKIFYPDALIYAGTSDGYIYGIRLYDDNTANPPKKAGELEKFISLGKDSQVPDIFVTSDDPATQKIYASISYNEQSENYSDVFCIRAKDIRVEDNPFIWKKTIPGKIDQRPMYYCGQEISYFVTDDGRVYAFSYDGNRKGRITIKESEALYSPIIVPNIPHSPEERKFIYKAAVIATLKGNTVAIETNFYGPPPPENLRVIAGENYIDLFWSAPTEGLTDYTIYRGTEPGREIPLKVVSASTLSYRDTEVEKGHTYYYYITSSSGALEGATGSEKSATVGSNSTTGALIALIAVIAIAVVLIVLALVFVVKKRSRSQSISYERNEERY